MSLGIKKTCQIDIKYWLLCFWPVYYRPRFSEYPGLTDMEQIGRQKQRAAAMEARKLVGSTDIV